MIVGSLGYSWGTLGVPLEYPWGTLGVSLGSLGITQVSSGVPGAPLQANVSEVPRLPTKSSLEEFAWLSSGPADPADPADPPEMVS